MEASCLVEAGKKLVADPIKRQFQYLFCYNKNIRNLGFEIDKLSDLTLDVGRIAAEAEGNKQSIYEHVWDWQRRVNEILDQSSAIYDDLGDISDPAAVKCLKRKCHKLKIRYMLNKRVTKTVIAMQDLLAKAPSFGCIACYQLPARIWEVFDSPVTPNYSKRFFPSRLSVARGIMDALSSYEVGVIGIYGPRGVGKTTLVEHIARRAVSELNFIDVVAPLLLYKTDLREIQEKLAEMLCLNLVTQSVPERAGELRKRLSSLDRRTLVIFDNSMKVIDLAELGIPDGNANCKVVVVSRLESICNYMGAQKKFAINVLSEQESWDLFKDIIGEQEENDIPGIVKDIVLRCGGLPREIKATGMELRSMDGWDFALERLRCFFPQKMPLWS